MSLLLAIDLGTEGARVGAFDPGGHLLGTAASPFTTRFPGPGQAEQDPLEWWRAICEATRGLLSQDAVRTAGQVGAVAVATTASTVVVLDEHDQPLRPAILWMDGRADAESTETATLAGRHEVLAHSGGADAAEWLVPKAMWLARHEPRTWARARRVVEAVDYLTYRLTGQWTSSRMNAVCKRNYDPRSGSVPAALYADLGIPDLVDKVPGDVRAVGTPAGTLSDAAAADLGLSGRPVVGVGGIDAHISLLGCGPAEAGLVSLVGGTSTVFVTEVPEPVRTPTIWGPYPDALRTGRWLIEGGQVSSGSVLRWTAEDILGVPRAEIGGLLTEAAAVRPDAHGLLVLDYFMGNRTPFRDARMRGAVLGLTLGTTPAQLYRATVEAVAYGTRSVLESFSSAGIPVSRLVVSGGIRHNPLWLSVTADVLGRPLEVVQSDNATLRAGAAIAAVAQGLVPDLDAAAAAFTPHTELVHPSGEHAAAYDAGYARYLAATRLVQPLVHDLVDSTVAGPGAGDARLAPTGGVR